MAKLTGKSVDKASDLLKKIKGNNTKFVNDKKVIDKIEEFFRNEEALKTIGGNEGLEAIIQANVRAGCETCGKATTAFLKNLDQYLDDVLDFATKYKGTDGFNDVIQELKKINKNKTPNYAVEGAAFMLDKIRKTPEITPQTVKKFDGKFTDEIDHICENCRFDIELSNGNKYEYKSYSKTAIKKIATSETFLKQHLSYLAETTDINKIHYEFDAKKFDNREKIIEQFKKMYQKNAKEVFEAMNSELRQNLFGKFSEENQMKIFEKMIQDNNSQLYNFIKL